MDVNVTTDGPAVQGLSIMDQADKAPSGRHVRCAYSRRPCSHGSEGGGVIRYLFVDDRFRWSALKRTHGSD